jgi:hypothetical protein
MVLVVDVVPYNTTASGGWNGGIGYVYGFGSDKLQPPGVGAVVGGRAVGSGLVYRQTGGLGLVDTDPPPTERTNESWKNSNGS